MLILKHMKQIGPSTIKRVMFYTINMAIINQKYIVNNQMQTLTINKAKQQQVIQSWDQQFKKTLTKRCLSFIDAHQPQQELISKPKLWWNLQSIQQYQQKQTSGLSVVNKCHGAYSQYIPINSNQCQANELTQYFLYLKHLQAKNNAEYQVCIFKISQLIQSNKDYHKWLKVCEQFLIDLPIQEMFHYYHFLLAKGPKCLREIKLKKNLKCKQSVFFHKVMEIRKLIAKENKVNSHLTISIDRGDKISLQNLSKTMKNLFCPICMIYDCQKHYLPVSAIQNNFEYVKQFDVRDKLQNKKISALNLLHHLLAIYKQQQTEGQKEYCSKNCFKLVDLKQWNSLKNKNRMRNYSPVFKAIVSMGVQLYYFNPCKIKTLLINSFKNQTGQNLQGNCSIIFSYFIQEYNLLQKMNIKFYDSQIDQLLSEAQMVTYIALSSTNKKGKKVKTKKTISNDQQYNSVCFHYFLNKQPQDITCTSCDCQIRGYCLPSCGCSEQCEIKLIGCRCKGESSCWENKCWCFKNNTVCIPEICGNCFRQDEQGKINWCRNNEKSINNSKRTMVGQSSIKGAGLGLFAGEYILKGEFVIKYLGQIIQSISLQKLRENLVENNLFYTFKLNKYESIDSRLYGNKARFINHSKKRANITPRTININQEFLIVFHALRDIQQGEQLLFNYNGEGELSEFKEKFPFID